MIAEIYGCCVTLRAKQSSTHENMRNGRKGGNADPLADQGQKMRMKKARERVARRSRRLVDLARPPI